MDAHFKTFAQTTPDMMRIVDWIYWLVRWLLGGLFIWAGVLKLAEPTTFVVLIDAFGVVPEAILMPVAIMLPTLEVLAGLGLLMHIKGSLRVIAAFLVCFVALLAWGIRMGLDVDCGCFGPSDPESRAFHGLTYSLYRDMLMLLGVGFIYGWRRYRDISATALTLFVQQMFQKRRKEDDEV